MAEVLRTAAQSPIPPMTTDETVLANEKRFRAQMAAYLGNLSSVIEGLQQEIARLEGLIDALGGGGGGSSLVLPLAIAQGGTEATTASGARTNLGLGPLATRADVSWLTEVTSKPATFPPDAHDHTAPANGSGLTNLNASALGSGTIPDARLPSIVDLYAAQATLGGIGTYVLANRGPNDIDPGATYPGAGVFLAGIIRDGVSGPLQIYNTLLSGSGTWRAMGHAKTGDSANVTLFLRIA